MIRPQPNWEAGMSRAFILGLLFASALMNSSSAQNKDDPNAGGPAYPGGSEITFQWDYSCASGKNCSFTCMGARGASHVTKLSIYLGTIPVGGSQKAPALIYEFSAQEIPRNNGFSVSAGLSTLSCQVDGMTLDYSGSPPNGRRTIDTTSGITQNEK
jgi:hypothetical protein